MTHAGSNIVDLIEHQAALQPEATAVISRSGETSYRELMSRIDGISTLLREKNIGAETAVGVCTDRSVNWITAMLGVLRSGAIYVPVNPMSPLPRKISMLENAGIRVLLTEGQTLWTLPSSVEALVLDELPTAPHDNSPRPPVLPGQAAYALCTSGSTAAPKIVVVPHASLWSYGCFLRRELPAGPTDHYLQTASMEFSAAIRQVITPLITGGTLVLAAQEEIRDPARLVSRMTQTRVTIFDTVPSYLSRWVAAVWELPPDWRDALAASLKLVLTTGEPLIADTVNHLAAALPAVRIFNLYGQAETTGTVAIHEAVAPVSDPIPIGGARDDCKFYVLNQELESSPEGELFISGPCLARSYQMLPDVTARSFLPDPFNRGAGRMYRTGDRVRCLDNGEFEFIGRTDRQVKFHGIRIELDEIESMLRKHPDVQDAAIVLSFGPDQDARLVAFVVLLDGGNGYGGHELRAFLSARLGESTTPGAIRFLDALPRTGSGKIDYPALMTADWPSSPRQSSSLSPSTPVERLIAKCWEDVLQITGIGVDDDFFALGGDSLQAIQMLILLQKLISKPLPLGGLFFQDPALGAFAQAIDEAAAGREANCWCPAKAAPRFKPEISLHG
jgi:amino acid adenylation domain-containing protein